MSHVIHSTFDDPRDYERSICPAKVRDIVVSESGAFEATLTNVNAGRVWLQSGSENLARTGHRSDSLKQALIAAMVACLTINIEQAYSSRSHRHRRVMLRFGEWLDTNKDRAVYLEEVCTALDTSAPTLRRCCEEHLGMSPMQYLWLRRMNLARREFLQRHSEAPVTATQ